MSELSHVDESGDVRMVDVGGKPLSRRRAVASAEVRMAKAIDKQMVVTDVRLVEKTKEEV